MCPYHLHTCVPLICIGGLQVSLSSAYVCPSHLHRRATCVPIICIGGLCESNALMAHATTVAECCPASHRVPLRSVAGGAAPAAACPLGLAAAPQRGGRAGRERRTSAAPHTVSGPQPDQLQQQSKRQEDSTTGHKRQLESPSPSPARTPVTPPPPTPQ